MDGNIAVSLIFVDNYDDVMETVDDERRPLLDAFIGRVLNAQAQRINGILLKYDKDKYFLIFTPDMLDDLKKRKYDILDQVRTIDMGNSIPITLSIGIGINGNTLPESMEFSRSAINLALERGGDQVIIRNRDEYQFYGGKAKETMSNTRVRARVKANAFIEIIREASNIIIMGHRNPDLDCLGASVGVFKIVQPFVKRCNIVLNSVTTNIKNLYDRLMIIDNYRNEVFVNSQTALSSINDNTLLIVVDCSRPSMVEDINILNKSVRRVVFDHHRKSSESIDKTILTYQESFASSTSELITEMFLYVQKPPDLLPVEADALLAGIMVDTKNFAFKTGAKTFEAAGYLKRNGADSVRVKMLFQNDMDTYKAKALAVNNAEIYLDNMAISITPDNVDNPTLTAAQAADDLLNISGVEASFVLCGCGEMDISISARSLGVLNVQMIMEKLGGGGHQTVAGAQLMDISADEAIIKLKDAIIKYLQESVR